MSQIEVHVDLETRATRDLLKVGMHKYSLCPDFDIMCMSMAINDGPVLSAKGFKFARPGDDMHAWDALRRHAEYPNAIFLAHNAGFEYTIYHNYLVPYYDFPPIPLNRWRCTAAAAAYRNLPRSLFMVSRALNVETPKDDAGYKIMMKMCKPIPESHTKMRELHGNWYEGDEDFEKLMRYCDTDVEAERQVQRETGLLPPEQQAEWELDQEINKRGIYVDLELCDGILELKEQIKAELADECTELAGFKPSQVSKLKAWMVEQGTPVPTKRDDKTREVKETLDSNHLKPLLADPSVPAHVKKALQMRQDYATTSLAKIDAVFNYEVDAVVHDQFLYHGASTGRWSGKGIQLHNLPRGSIDEKCPQQDMALLCNLIKRRSLEGLKEWYPGMRLMELLKTAIRGVVIARPGYMLQVMDFSQIESRVLAWLAGQEDKLDIFRSGKDVYKYNACAVYGTTYDKVTKAQRSGGGKVSELACGFGGGKGAIKSMAANLGLHFTDEEAEDIKVNWRAGSPHIVQFWYDVQSAAIKAVVTGKGTKIRDIKFKMIGKWLACRLPSGRKLWYYDPEVESVETDYGRKQQISYMGVDSARNIPWGRIRTYGARLVENITQAVARDMLAHAMKTSKEAEYNQVLHVHDELGHEVAIGDNTRPLNNLKLILEDMPEWADGCPVTAAGFESDRYRKD